MAAEFAAKRHWDSPLGTRWHVGEQLIEPACGKNERRMRQVDLHGAAAALASRTAILRLPACERKCNSDTSLRF